MAFSSAVADRLSFWGAPGSSGVAWGSWEQLGSYTGHLAGFLPASLAPAFAVLATVLEVVAAIGLLAGWQLHWMALLAGMLRLSFGAARVVADGVRGPLDYSAFTAAAAGL